MYQADSFSISIMFRENRQETDIKMNIRTDRIEKENDEREKEKRKRKLCDFLLTLLPKQMCGCVLNVLNICKQESVIAENPNINEDSRKK